MKPHNIVLNLFIFTLLVLGIQQPILASDIQITDAWVREAPPAARVLAGYMTLSNTSTTPVTLIGVASDISKTTEMHDTVINNGIARMIEQKKIPLLPGKTVSFTPGGQHLMLMNIYKAVKAGDIVTLTLSFEDGSSATVKAAVRQVSGGIDHSHHHH